MTDSIGLEKGNATQDNGFLLPEAAGEGNSPSPLQMDVAAADGARVQYNIALMSMMNRWMRSADTISKDLLVGALTITELPAAEKGILKPFVDHFDAIAKLSADDFNDVRRSDINQVIQLYGDQQIDGVLADKAKAYATANFKNIDMDGDGLLSQGELLNHAEVTHGDEKILATYLYKREPDIALVNPSADRGKFADATSMERGISMDDVTAMTATAITDAHIANLYMRSRLEKGRDFAGKNGSFIGAAIGKAYGSYLDSKNGPSIRAFLTETAPQHAVPTTAVGF